MNRPRLLDLFCGAGGCAVGYHRAGFDVVGVDHKPQKNYPFEFHLADALEFVARHGREFDAIHASPPCQRYCRSRWGNRRHEHPDLVGPTRVRLDEVGVPYVIENVVGAPMSAFSIVLCGTMFGLKVFRHRLFETSFLCLQPRHSPHNGTTGSHRGYAGNGGVNGYVTVVGRTFKLDVARRAMGIDWMRQKEISQAVPPAYTEYVGRQLMAVMEARR